MITIFWALEDNMRRMRKLGLIPSSKRSGLGDRTPPDLRGLPGAKFAELHFFYELG